MVRCPWPALPPPPGPDDVHHLLKGSHWETDVAAVVAVLFNDGIGQPSHLVATLAASILTEGQAVACPWADMAASLAQEARDAMSAPEQEEEAPDADSVFAKLKDLKTEGDDSEKPAD